MKKFIPILTLLISSYSYSQIPDYFANNPSWHCGLWDSNQWGPPPFVPTNNDYVYYLTGDTLIFGQSFKIVWRRGEVWQNGPTPQSTYDIHSGYYLRQEGRSIRFYTEDNGVDSLLVDYDLQVGDTVKGDIFSICGFSQDTIQKIDSILIGSEFRRVFYLDSISGPVVFEGMGHLVNNSGDNSGEFIQPICTGIGFDHSIKCYGQNEVPLWDPIFGTTVNCHVNVGIESEDNIHMEFSPNPATDMLNVKIPNLFSNGQLVIYDLQGKILDRVEVTDSSIQLDVSDLDNGTYLMKYIRDEVQIIEKLIIQH